MTITTFRNVEPLYIVILQHTNQPEALFKSWIKTNRIDHASVTGNKMMLHDRHGLEKFRVTWMHSMEMITVWDTWNKRHIYLD